MLAIAACKNHNIKLCEGEKQSENTKKASAACLGQPCRLLSMT
jgi:hypothetical protein